MRDLRVAPRAGLAISGLVAAALVMLAFVATRPPAQVTKRGVGGSRTEYGKTIALPIGLGLVKDCGCPGPPAEGEAGVANIVRAWEENADFGFVFADGMTLSFEGTAETPEEFAKRIQGSLDNPDESGPIGRLVPLRGTQAWVKELDDHGPAFVEWVEAGKELTLIGGDVQDLSAVIEVAGGLTPSKA